MPVLEDRFERRGRRPRQVLPGRTCRRPNLGTAGRGRPGPLPGRRRSRHLHGERDLLLRAHHGPQRCVEKRGGEERRGPPGRAPLRTRPGHAGLPPTRRRRRQERPRRAARSGRWASALGCLLRAAPPASRAPGSLGEQKKERGVGEGGEEEEGAKGGEREAGGGGGREPRLSHSGRPAPPRRPGGVRLAPAGGREAPRGRGLANSSVLGGGGARPAPPGHCGRRVLYNSAVRRRGSDSRTGPRLCPDPGGRGCLWGDWGGRRGCARGRLRRGRRGRVPASLRGFSGGKGPAERQKSAEGAGAGTGLGAPRVPARALLRGRPRLLPRPRRLTGEGAKGGAGSRALGSGSGRSGAAPEAPGARPGLPSCWRSSAPQPGVRATAAAAGLSGPGREATAAPGLS